MTVGARSPYQVLAAAINAQVELLYQTQVTLLQYSSQPFLWHYQNANQVFNLGTFGYLSARISAGDAPGLAKTSEPGGLPNAYARLLSQVEYVASTADIARHDPVIAEQARYGNWLLGGLRQATCQPSAGNGGILTVDPDTGAVSTAYQVGYAVNTALATIQGGLMSGQPVLTVSVPAANGATATLRYPGVQMVAVQAAAWQQATGAGWWYPDPISEAFRNGQQDITGFRFVTPPSYHPGPLDAGGDLGWLVSLLISNPPVVTMQTADSRLPRSSRSPEVASFFDSLRLLDLDGSMASVAASPAMLVGSSATDGPDVPVLQQTAYVIGAALAFPG
jgi:hypothetical protein